MYAGRPLTWAQAVSIALVAWYVRAAGAPLAVWLALRFPFRGRRWLRALAVHLPASLLVAVAEQMLYAILVRRLSWVPQRAAGNFELHMNVLIWWVVVAATHGVDYYHRFRERELASSRLQAELVGARLDALRAQLQPHFLFNTLNTVSSLVRFDPDQAREIIVKLASILRRLLRSHESFVRLREEVEFIDDYLDIEVVRFGRDKLRVVKELDPETLEALVPSMILQPLVENSIKHGLAPKVEGGSITLRSRLENANASADANAGAAASSSLLIEVEDDGVGIDRKSVV